jgi:hypothetical protein
MSLQEDIDSLPTIKKARLKLSIQTLIVESLEESEITEELLEEEGEHYEN